MKEFSELIKNIETLRRLSREFFVFGYKSRSDYDKKAVRPTTMVTLMNYSMSAAIKMRSAFRFSLTAMLSTRILYIV